MYFGRTRVGVVLVALVVLLAGCSGGAGGDAADVTTAEPTADTNDEATAADSGGEDGAGETATDADAAGSDVGEASDGGMQDTPLGAPLSSIAAADSYTVDFTLTSENAEGTIDFDGRIMVAADGTQYTDWTIDLSSGQTIVAEQYLPAGETIVYSRVTFGDDDPFVSSTERSENTIPAGLDNPYELTGGEGPDDAPEWRYEGIVQTPDGPRGKYVVDSVDQLSSTSPTYEPNLEYRDVEFIVYVDPDTDQVTRMVYTAVFFDTEAGIEENRNFEFRYVDVGSTTIDRPDWVDQA